MIWSILCLAAVMILTALPELLRREPRKIQTIKRNPRLRGADQSAH